MSANGVCDDAESAHGSEEESQGSAGEDEAHHRTVRGREAQQIVHRLKHSYLHRSMSAPDAALSPGALLLMPGSREARGCS